MDMTGWRDRLTAVLKKKKLSMRSVSLASGNAGGYVHSILKDNKDPTLGNLVAVCEAVPVSTAFILYGFDITPEDEAILTAMHEEPEMRDAVVTLLRKRLPAP